MKWFKLDASCENLIYMPIEKLPANMKQAFEKSIEAWTLRSKGEGINSFDENVCGLCNLYIKKDCRSCPIKMETKKDSCRNNEYYQIWITLDTEQEISKTGQKIAFYHLHWLKKLRKKYLSGKQGGRNETLL